VRVPRGEQVTEEAIGNGLAEDLWEAIAADHPQVATGSEVTVDARAVWFGLKITNGNTWK
jgi:hypothetical protein